MSSEEEEEEEEAALACRHMLQWLPAVLHISLLPPDDSFQCIVKSGCSTHLTINQGVFRIGHASVAVGATVRVQIGVLLLRRGSCCVRHEVWQVRGRFVEEDSLSARWRFDSVDG
jgi:hypothetical protein